MSSILDFSYMYIYNLHDFISWFHIMLGLKSPSIFFSSRFPVIKDTSVLKLLMLVLGRCNAVWKAIEDFRVGEVLMALTCLQFTCGS